MRFWVPRDSQAKVSGSVGDLNASRLKPPKKFTLLHDLLYWLNTRIFYHEVSIFANVMYFDATYSGIKKARSSLTGLTFLSGAKRLPRGKTLEIAMEVG